MEYNIKITAITSLQNLIDSVLSGALHSQYGLLIGFISSFTLACVILYLLCMGYMVLAGKVQAPINEIIFKLISLSIIFGICLNSDGFMDWIIGWINGLKSELAGEGGNYAAMLDHMITKKLEIIDQIWNNAKDFEYKASALISIALVAIGSLFFIVPVAVALLVNDISLKCLLATAPLFIFCLSFQFIRSMFNNWLQLCFSSILFVMFIMIFIQMQNQLDTLIVYDKNGSALAYGFSFLIVGIVSSNFVRLAHTLASQIASVSADGVAVSLSNQLGTELRRQGLRGAKTVGKVGYKTAKTANDIAGAGIDVTGRAIWNLSHKLRNRQRGKG